CARGGSLGSRRRLHRPSRPRDRSYQRQATPSSGVRSLGTWRTVWVSDLGHAGARLDVLGCPSLHRHLRSGFHLRRLVSCPKYAICEAGWWCSTWLSPPRPLEEASTRLPDLSSTRSGLGWWHGWTTTIARTTPGTGTTRASFCRPRPSTEPAPRW